MHGQQVFQVHHRAGRRLQEDRQRRAHRGGGLDSLRRLPGGAPRVRPRGHEEVRSRGDIPRLVLLGGVSAVPVHRGPQEIHRELRRAPRRRRNPPHAPELHRLPRRGGGLDGLRGVSRERHRGPRGRPQVRLDAARLRREPEEVAPLFFVRYSSPGFHDLILLHETIYPFGLVISVSLCWIISVVSESVRSV